MTSNAGQLYCCCIPIDEEILLLNLTVFGSQQIDCHLADWFLFQQRQANGRQKKKRKGKLLSSLQSWWLQAAADGSIDVTTLCTQIIKCSLSSGVEAISVKHCALIRLIIDLMILANAFCVRTKVARWCLSCGQKASNRITVRECVFNLGNWRCEA